MLAACLHLVAVHYSYLQFYVRYLRDVSCFCFLPFGWYSSNMQAFLIPEQSGPWFKRKKYYFCWISPSVVIIGYFTLTDFTEVLVYYLHKYLKMKELWASRTCPPASSQTVSPLCLSQVTSQKLPRMCRGHFNGFQGELGFVFWWSHVIRLWLFLWSSISTLFSSRQLIIQRMSGYIKCTVMWLISGQLLYFQRISMLFNHNYLITCSKGALEKQIIPQLAPKNVPHI